MLTLRETTVVGFLIGRGWITQQPAAERAARELIRKLDATEAVPPVREALEFYADKENYTFYEGAAVMEDEGRRARAALERTARGVG